MMDEKDLGWLIRDNANVIRGPYKHNEILQLIKKGQLKGKTEVSRANSYWFTLEEKMELARFFPELGISVPEQTLMTATLTQAVDFNEPNAVEITQFTPSPNRKELAEDKPMAPGVEWLNEDFADEFGEAEFSVETPNTAVTQPAAPDRQPTPDEANPQEMLNRASVKADTLPSEQKNYTGDRPRPINAVMKGPEKHSKPGPAPQPAMVTVPIDAPEGQAKILSTEQEDAGNRGRRKRVLLLVGGVSAALVLATAAVTFLNSPGPAGVPERKASVAGSAETLLKKSLILFQLESAREALSELELEVGAKGKVTLPLAQALMKKEFLYDADGAFMALQTASSLAPDKRTAAEVENLMANYRFERDREGSVDALKKLVASSPSEAVFRYNLGLALARSGRQQEALQEVSGMVGTIKRGNPLAEDVAFLTGWAKEVYSKGTDSSAEAAYLAALDANPQSGKARLGLAIHRLRRNGLRDSEADFRAFLEALPDLDPPTQVLNFRKMSDFDFYSYARSQLRDLNIPLGAVGKKPSPLIMAVDAVLSCLQSRTGEAGKILESALSADPGDPQVLKAVGFHRWKEGRYPELVDLLKDLPKEKNSFSINLLLGKSYLKIGRKDLAEAHFENLTDVNPMRSEGWSLLGELQLQLGRTESAKKNFENALQRDALDIVALRGMERLGLPGVINPEIATNLPF
jgi:tetratricopeptide (TPR) repeat protein